ncbi:MAG: type III-A CRISPR-associated RAMP protein Csm3 [Planctomycetota bacterium]|nr:type III-A CRISPR-associated RAMP protein Csm3 [Planctomycetota bacterium]
MTANGNVMKLKLIGYRNISGIIELVTGLHIGAGHEEIAISGNDNPILRTALNGEPYIPGSSLKGKMRSLLEWATGVHPRGEVRGFQGAYDAAPVLTVFGVPAGEAGREGRPCLGPTRLLVADAFLATEQDGGTRGDEPYDWRKAFLDDEWDSEIKTENSINRITSVANPRPMERVPAGVQFAFSMRYRVFDVNGNGGEKDRENFEWVRYGMGLLENDALGGGGSRGNGIVKFRNLKCTDECGESRKIEPLGSPPSNWVSKGYADRAGAS